MITERVGCACPIKVLISIIMFPLMILSAGLRPTTTTARRFVPEIFKLILEEVLSALLPLVVPGVMLVELFLGLLTLVEIASRLL